MHYILILAAGKGSRLKSPNIPKQFLEIDNLPIVMHSAISFSSAIPNSEIHIALPKKHFKEWPKICKKYNFNIKHQFYIGGKTRSESVWIGLKKINKLKQLISKKGAQKDLISIHDGARPFIDKNFILDLIEKFKSSNIRSVIPTIKLKNAILEYSNKANQSISQPLNRENYLLSQTPQSFYFSDIFKAYYLYYKDVKNFNNLHDDLSVFMRYFKKIKLNSIKKVVGREYNMKITTDLDYFILKRVYKFFKKSSK